MKRRSNRAEDPPQIFISYSHREADTAFARQLRDRLHSMGYQVWIDERSIPIGDTFDDRIDEGLRNSDAVIGIITPSSVASKNVRNEWVFAQENEIRLLLLLLEPTQIPMQFIRINYLDFTKQEKGAAFARLEEDLARTLGGEERGNGRSREEQAWRASERIEQGDLPSPEMVRLQRFQTSGIPAWVDFTTEEEQLWISDGEQIEAFVRGSPYREDRWLLPNRRWKLMARELWQDRLLCSDWEGSLYAFGGPNHGQDETVYRARYDDLPIHLLTVGRSGQLLAATWDGRLRVWNRDGQPLFPLDKVVLPRLPLQIFSCGPGCFAVLDRGQTVWIYDEAGEPIWTWEADGDVTALWGYRRNQDKSSPLMLMMLIDNTRIVRVQTDVTPPSEIKTLSLPSPARLFSHLDPQEGEGWTVLALEDGTLAWLSWLSFRLPSAYQVDLEWGVRDLIALHDPQRPSALVSLGITDTGHLFATSDRKVREYPLSPIHMLCPDPSGRFLFCVLEEGVEMYRNPAILPVACEVTVGSVEGTLVVGEYRELVINLVNSGSIPISRLSATLRGRDRIIPSSEIVRMGEFLPGQRIPLRLSVQAIAAGTLQVELRVAMEDESGPPAIETRLNVHVQSKRAREG
ncbi:MAG: TIR domain-containing protein [Anaerolineae bacterium]